MHQLQRSWIRSQHTSAQWNLRGGRWNSVWIPYSTKKNPLLPPPPQKKELKKSNKQKNLSENFQQRWIVCIPIIVPGRIETWDLDSCFFARNPGHVFFLGRPFWSHVSHRTQTYRWRSIVWLPTHFNEGIFCYAVKAVAKYVFRELAKYVYQCSGSVIRRMRIFGLYTGLPDSALFVNHCALGFNYFDFG